MDATPTSQPSNGGSRPKDYGLQKVLTSCPKSPGSTLPSCISLPGLKSFVALLQYDAPFPPAADTAPVPKPTTIARPTTAPISRFFMRFSDVLCVRQLLTELMRNLPFSAQPCKRLNRITEL